jgi:hypothetical protein
MTGERSRWRDGQATRADETPAAAARSVAVRILATPSHGAERFDSSIPTSRRANPRGTK